MKIGTSIYDNSPKKKEKWFKLESGSNIYRILPPTDELAKYNTPFIRYTTHTIATVNSNNEVKYFTFICPEKYGFNGEISTECPLCKRYRDNYKKYELAKAKGLPPQQLQEFFKREVFNFKPQYKYYAQALNLNNEISVLPIPATVYKQLREKLRILAEKLKFDPAGNTGVFFDIKKIQKFKGDRDTMYLVEEVMEQVSDNSSNINMQYKTHTITPDFINKWEAKNVNLMDLFKTLTHEELQLVASTTYDGLYDVLEKIFSNGKKQQPISNTDVEVRIEGTSSYFIPSIELKKDGNLEINTYDPNNAINTNNVTVSQTTAAVNNTKENSQNSNNNASHLNIVNVNASNQTVTSTNEQTATKNETKEEYQSLEEFLASINE